MTGTGIALGSLALTQEPRLRQPRLRPGDVLGGLISAAGLYVIFRIGDRVARLVMPRGDAEIGEIYQLRTLRPPWELALRLAGLIGPAEELFWRGHVQERLMERYGGWPGTLLATACYGAVHLASRNATLVGAATVAGAYWGLLARLGVSMPALIVSHVAWDIWIFLVAPTAPTPPSTAGTRGS